MTAPEPAAAQPADVPAEPARKPAAGKKPVAAKKPAAAKKRAAAKKPPTREPVAAKKPRAAAKYPSEIRAVTKRANELRGAKGFGVGPVQIVRVTKVLREGAEGELTAKSAIAQTGASSLAELKRWAQGEGDRKSMAVLRPLAQRVGDSFCTGRWLAAQAAAIAEGLAKADAARGR